jgi:adenylyltransferase/sulfurtransferase
VLTNQEQRRYQRHILLKEIGQDGQEKLKNSKVLIIGAGGLGAPVMQYLCAAGVGKLGIIDHDMVSESNLQRQVLYGDLDIGKLKSIISRQRLEAQNSLVEVEIINLRFNHENADRVLPPYDLVMDATDNFETRYTINDTCIQHGKPIVYGAIHEFEGQVSVFNYKGGPSLRCVFPEQPSDGAVPDPNRQGLLGILPGIIGSFQANEAIKLITGIGQTLSGYLYTYNILDNSSYKIKIKRNKANFKIPV